jgi:hypothetical protein
MQADSHEPARGIRLLTGFGLLASFGSLPTPFRLDPAGLGVDAPITDHSSPPLLGSDPAGPQARRIP